MIADFVNSFISDIILSNHAIRRFAAPIAIKIAEGRRHKIACLIKSTADLASRFRSIRTLSVIKSRDWYVRCSERLFGSH